MPAIPPWVGLLGQGWRTPAETHIEADTDATRLIDMQGRTITFAHLSPGEEQFSPSEGVRIARGTEDKSIPWEERWQWLPEHYRHNPQLLIVTAGEGDYLIFEPVLKPTAATDNPHPVPEGRYELCLLLTRHGYVTRFTWSSIANAHGHPQRFPEWVTDSARRIYRLHPAVLSEQHEADRNAHHPHPDNGVRIAGISLAWDPFDTHAGPNDFASLRQKSERRWLVQYRYSRAGDLVQVLDGEGDRSVDFGYERHMLTRKQTPDGRDVSYQYDRLAPEGKVIRQTQTGGLTLDFVYGADATRVTDSLGRITVYHFQGEAGLRRLVELQHPDGSIVKMDYTRDGQMSCVTDPLDRKTRHTHTAQGEYLGSINALGHREESYLDHSTGLVTATRNAEGQTTHFRRDATGNITQIIAPDGGTTGFEYSHPQFPDRPTVIVDARGGTKRLDYNPLGQLHRHTDCSGQATTYLRDSVGQLQALESADGSRQAYRRDSKGRITRIELADGRSEAFEYDQSGRLSKAIDPQGRPVEMQYDRYGRITEHRVWAGSQGRHEGGAEWSITRFEYDPAGRLVKLANAQGAMMGFGYDVMDRLVQEIGFDGKRSTYGYNLAGELVAQTDGKGGADAIEIRHEHDALGRLVARHLPEWNGSPAQVQRFDYNRLSQLTSATTYNSRVEFVYNPLGQLIAETQSSADGFSQTLRFGYDVLGKRNQMILPDGQSIDTLTYGSGHWHQIAFNGHALIDVERDSLHREVSRTYGSGSQQMVAQPLMRTQGYTALGQLAMASFTRVGKILEQRKHQYDPGDLLTQIACQLDHAHQLVRYAYDVQQRLVAWDMHDLIDSPAGANPANGKPGFKQMHKQAYAHDKAGNPIPTGAVMRLDPVSNQAVYATPEQWAQQVHSNRDNPGFNLLGQNMARANRTAQLEDVSYQYDERGNVTRRTTHDGMWEFSWNALNQMTVARFASAGSSASAYVTGYFYDAFGRRIGKKIFDLRKLTTLPDGEEDPASMQTTLIRYLWDGERMLQEIHAGHVQTIVYEPDSFVPLAQLTQKKEAENLATQTADERQCRDMERHSLTQLMGGSAQSPETRRALMAQLRDNSAREEDTQIHLFITDHLGTPTKLLDAATHAVVWEREQDPWGNTLKETSSDALPKECIPTLRFQGQQYDWETGLHYNRYRFYDPRMRRYVSQDLIGLNGGLNFYGYPENPVQRIDPLGLATEVVAWGAFGAGESQFGHLTTTVNGQLYSWNSPGAWDKSRPLSKYVPYQQQFRDGNGVKLKLTPQQERKLIKCLNKASGEYKLLSNNCGTAAQNCLKKIGVDFDSALIPKSIVENLKKSPEAIGSTFYPGPEKEPGPLSNPAVWGF